jgi:hypothetical protein
MLPASVAKAILFFESENHGEISRAAVMAYSTLYAVQHYYFDLLNPEILDLLEKNSWIRELEPGRVLKQKRIMSWVISRELAVSKMTHPKAQTSWIR